MSRPLIIPFILVWLIGIASTAFATNTTTIEIETEVHFLTPSGEDVLVGPGIYTLERAEEWLKLIAEERRDAILLETMRLTHKESLSTSAAFSLKGEEDRHHLVLLLPTGTRLEAVGTYSGLRTRATFSPVRIPSKTLEPIVKTQPALRQPTLPVVKNKSGLQQADKEGANTEATFPLENQIFFGIERIEKALKENKEKLRDLERALSQLKQTVIFLQGYPHGWSAPFRPRRWETINFGKAARDKAGGKAVRDKETGLVWEQAPAKTQVTLRKAIEGCLNLKVGKKQGWRLPTAEEFTSLVPFHKHSIFSHLGNVSRTEYFWTSSPSIATGTSEADAATYGTTVRFRAESRTFHSAFVHPEKKDKKKAQWCVRGR